MSDFNLTDAERISPVWARVKEIIEDRIAKHRIANDGDKSPEDTAKLRGRIAELKDLLKLDRAIPPVTED
jgi:hypothetical protein